jgi:hypothetical protein
VHPSSDPVDDGRGHKLQSHHSHERDRWQSRQKYDPQNGIQPAKNGDHKHDRIARPPYVHQVIEKPDHREQKKDRHGEQP